MIYLSFKDAEVGSLRHQCQYGKQELGPNCPHRSSNLIRLKVAIPHHHLLQTQKSSGIYLNYLRLR